MKATTIVTQGIDRGHERLPRWQPRRGVATRSSEAYRDAGADILLVLPKTSDEARAIGERICGLLHYIMLGGVASMGISAAELGRVGYRPIGKAVTPLLAGFKALRECY